ncbi:hypothetical protein FACS1894160_4940 [Bacteroidia bacterium]|nr:hypothetical protein FACS1894160_4940 [Bacteroidia bacterium]
MKNIIWFTVVTTLCLAVVILFVAISCDNSENQPETCNVDNPLTDLPWLKTFVDGCERDAAAGYPPHARIYQCTYRDGIGFLLDICVDCPDAGLWLRSCDGESLCIFGGLAGNTCPELEFNVDFENKKLIWESSY